MTTTLPKFVEVHIENTNSCAYKCIMCPREQQTRQIGFMSFEDFSLALDRIGPFEGIFHLHGYGEALLDRQLVKKVAALRKKNPSANLQIISTLGVRVQEDFFTQLAEAGLDVLIISFYGFTRDAYKKVHGFDGFDLAKRNLELLSKVSQGSIKSYIKIPSQNVYSSLPIMEDPDKRAFCQWAEDLGFSIGEWTYVHNYGNGRHYHLPNSQRLCPVIEGMRKNILNITWDLHVIPCCYDFNATIRFGSLRQQSLEEIFSSQEYLKFLLAHKTNELSAYPICQNCEKQDQS